jgi:hypothetical protein
VAVNLLLSYAFHANTRLDEVRRGLVCGRLMVDSGAFTAFTKGRKLTVEEYAAYLQRWVGCWDHAVTLDVIGNPAASRANTRRLHDLGLPVMPVFTLSDTLAEFDAMIRDCGYVAVGGLVGLPRQAQAARVGMLQRRARGNGGTVHALGIGSMPILRAARPYSGDASTVTSVFRYGTVVYFTGADLRQVYVKDHKRFHRDRDHIRAHGIDMAPIVRTGRMPTDPAARTRLVQAMNWAYAAADEHLKHTCPTPAVRPNDPDGPHLYNAVGAGSPIDLAVSVDQRIHHTSDHPPIWRVYGRTHTCTAKEPNA